MTPEIRTYDFRENAKNRVTVNDIFDLSEMQNIAQNMRRPLKSTFTRWLSFVENRLTGIYIQAIEN